MRSSLSWARRRRLRCLPSPAASSISIRRSRGLESTIASTRPWETTECISLPRPVSDSTSTTSARRQRAPLRRYSPSPSRPSLRRIEISEKSVFSSAAVAVVDHHLDLGRAGALDAVAAGEDHVLHRLAAHRQRALLAERPQHGVGDVRLARAVGPDHHADPGREVELGAVREGLEALHRDRLAGASADRRPSLLGRQGRAWRPPARRPSWSAPSPGPARGRRTRRSPRSCARAPGRPGPRSGRSRSRPAGPAAPAARDLWSTGFSSAPSMASSKAATTAGATRSMPKAR